MKNDSFKEQLDLLQEARQKIDSMKVGSVFVTDFGACALLERVIVAYQDLMLENISLKKKIRLYKIDAISELKNRAKEKNKE